MSGTPYLCILFILSRRTHQHLSAPGGCQLEPKPLFSTPSQEESLTPQGTWATLGEDWTGESETPAPLPSGPLQRFLFKGMKTQGRVTCTLPH